MNEQCDECGAEIVYGNAHRMTEQFWLEPARIVIRCEECVRVYSEMLWSDDWGPYPGAIHHKPGTT
jgi:hypothetical protein